MSFEPIEHVDLWARLAERTDDPTLRHGYLAIALWNAVRAARVDPNGPILAAIHDLRCQLGESFKLPWEDRAEE